MMALAGLPDFQDLMEPCGFVFWGVLAFPLAALVVDTSMRWCSTSRGCFGLYRHFIGGHLALAGLAGFQDLVEPCGFLFGFPCRSRRSCRERAVRGRRACRWPSPVSWCSWAAIRKRATARARRAPTSSPTSPSGSASSVTSSGATRSSFLSLSPSSSLS